MSTACANSRFDLVCRAPDDVYLKAKNRNARFEIRAGNVATGAACAFATAGKEKFFGSKGGPRNEGLRRKSGHSMLCPYRKMAEAVERARRKQEYEVKDEIV